VIIVVATMAILLPPAKDDDAKSIDAWHRANNEVRSWLDCDGSLTCTAAEHKIGCYSDGYDGGYR
jgi:hypothetical protein